jgi:hypothetical protein
MGDAAAGGVAAVGPVGCGPGEAANAGIARASIAASVTPLNTVFICVAPSCLCQHRH